MLCENFKVQNIGRGKVNKCPAIPFVSDKDSTTEVNKIEITLKFFPGTAGDKSNVTKSPITKFKDASWDQGFVVLETIKVSGIKTSNPGSSD
eukprot:7912394-Ditylum_brightwellii.AAC.1